MTQVIVIFVLAAAVLGVWAQGPRWAFRWIYLPTLLLVPVILTLDMPGLPDLNPQRAAAVGIILGAVTRGNHRHLLPKWRPLDLLVLFPVLTFSISYSLATNLKGFYHEVPVLFMDWACPYVFARALIVDGNDLRRTLAALAVWSATLAFLALYECRMATRLSVTLWNLLDVGLPKPSHYGDWRWGFLRAYTHWLGPITLATGFAMLAPLMVAWSLLEPRHRRFAWIAAGMCVLGCVSGLSRGPVLVLIVVGVVFFAAAYRMKRLAIVGIACAVLMLPFLMEVAGKTISYTQQRVAATGNTANESAHYRIALLIMYGKTITEVGMWGDRSVIGAEFEKANSIDNAYLYLFLIGGWVGGGTIVLIVLIHLKHGIRALRCASGRDRQVLAAIVASFAAVSGCMANVWFCPDYVPLFWIGAGLLTNSLQIIGPRRATVAAPRPADVDSVLRPAT